jgi:hypothetical protein
MLKFSTDRDPDMPTNSTTPVRLNLLSANGLVTFPQINRTLLLLLEFKYNLFLLAAELSIVGEIRNPIPRD